MFQTEPVVLLPPPKPPSEPQNVKGSPRNDLNAPFVWIRTLGCLSDKGKNMDADLYYHDYTLKI